MLLRLGPVLLGMQRALGKLGAPPASRRPQEPLPACQLQERGWGGAVSIPGQQTPEQGPGTLKPHRESGSWGQTAWVRVWVSSYARLAGLLPGELS